MATSGIYTLSKKAIDIISEALDMLQIAADGETITGSQVTRSIKSLNELMKKWQQQGIHLWSYTEGSLLLQKGQPVYDFNDSSTRLTNNLINDTLAADSLSGSFTITVNDGSLFSDGDNITVILSDRTAHITTINGAPVGDVITLTDALTGDTNIGQAVYAYNDEFIPISRILDIRRVDSTTYEVPMNMEPRDRYMEQPNKVSLGVPVISYYSRQIPQGTMYLWANPNDATTYINFTYERQFQIVEKPTDDVDFPQEWRHALTTNLAVLLAKKMGASAALYQELKADAKDALDQALSYDNAIYGHEIRIVNQRDR